MTTDPPPYSLIGEFGRLAANTKDGFPFLGANLSDTNVVLLGTSLIDQYLKFVLISGFRADAASKRLIEAVFDGNGPLATFSAKISLCSALGLVGGDDVRHDLTVLRKIRNEFAHAYVELKLSSFSQCSSLRLAANLNIEDDDALRKKFKLSCAGIIPHLALSALVNIAKDRFITANAEKVQEEYEKMLKEVYDDPAPSG